MPFARIKNEALVRCASGHRLTPVHTMASLPPFDGVAVPSCACIRADDTTIRAIDALTGVDGKRLPRIKSPGEHEIFSSHLTIDGGGI